MVKKPRIYRVLVGKIVLWYNDRIINHIAKHNVKIDEVIQALEDGKPILLRLKKSQNDWVAIAKHPYSGRFLTIFLEETGKLVFRLKTARDSSEAEKRLYKKMRS
jgi:uncharacterized DUF497 family protein